jgi:hypothetical protein
LIADTKGAEENIWSREGGWRRLHNEKLHILYTSPNYYLGDQVREDEVGDACIIYGRNEKCIQYFGWKTRREETTWKT